MIDDELELLGRFRSEVPVPDAQTAERVYRLATTTQPHRRARFDSRLSRLLLVPPAIAVTVAVVLVAVLFAPWRDSPLATERALAALGRQPVLHAIVEQAGPRVSVVELASGRERVESPRVEFWFDEERASLRVRVALGDHVLPGGEYVQTPEGIFTGRGRQVPARPPRLDPALEGFASGYRDALDGGRATVAGNDVVDGRKAIILRFSLPPSPQGETIAEDVAVDASDYRPLRFRFSHSGTTIPWSQAPRVVEIETVPRDPHDFQPPPREEPRLSGQSSRRERKLEPAEAATALGHSALWPGPDVEGAELAQIELKRVTTRWTDGRVSKGHALEFRYGTDERTARLEGKPSLVITESTSATENEGFETFMFGGSAPQPGELQLTAVDNSNGGDAVWFGDMQQDGVYLSFRSTQRDLIVTAAKALVRLG